MPGLDADSIDRQSVRLALGDAKRRESIRSYILEEKPSDEDLLEEISRTWGSGGVPHTRIRDNHLELVPSHRLAARGDQASSHIRYLQYGCIRKDWSDEGYTSEPLVAPRPVVKLDGRPKIEGERLALFIREVLDALP